MRTFKIIAAFALTAMTVVACGASPDASTESTESTQAAVSGGASCQTDSNCGKGLVCDLHCPIIPGRAHCEIAGGTCEPVCKLPASDLSGTTFASLDGAHSITFETKSSYSKSDGCPTTGIHCEHVAVSTGTYASNGTEIVLESTDGTFDTLVVEPHCYDGLYDNGDGVELYPVPVAD